MTQSDTFEPWGLTIYTTRGSEITVQRTQSGIAIVVVNDDDLDDHQTTLTMSEALEFIGILKTIVGAGR